MQMPSWMKWTIALAIGFGIVALGWKLSTNRFFFFILPAFFVLNQLFLMREGVRKVEAMAPIVKDLKDDDLTNLSQHFAALAPKRSDEAVDAALAKKGAEIATQRRCSSCHLPSLAGQEQMPRLARQRIDYLIETLKSYRDSPRPGADTAMSAAIAGATDADITALAHYAASL